MYKMMIQKENIFTVREEYLNTFFYFVLKYALCLYFVSATCLYLGICYMFILRYLLYVYT